MARKNFQKLVQEALARIPKEFQAALNNVAIVIGERPGAEAQGEEFDPEEETLYGLYCGLPLPERTADNSGALPDVIYLYQEPLEEDFPDRDDLIEEIEITLVHEIAHYFGFDEETLERYGYE